MNSTTHAQILPVIKYTAYPLILLISRQHGEKRGFFPTFWKNQPCAKNEQ